jgi:hypothetical protein
MTATAKVLPLYKTLDIYDEIHECIAERGGELTPELEQRLDDAYEKIGDKLQGARDWYFSVKATKAAYRAERQRLAAAEAACDRSMEWAKSYVEATLRRLEVEKYPLRRGKLWLQNNSSWSISWPGDPETAPKAYQRWTCIVNGEKAQEDFKAGTLPEGFTAERGKHMRLS